jgi:hypothetical protein
MRQLQTSRVLRTQELQAPKLSLPTQTKGTRIRKGYNKFSSLLITNFTKAHPWRNYRIRITENINKLLQYLDLKASLNIEDRFIGVKLYQDLLYLFAQKICNNYGKYRERTKLS